MVSVRKRGKVYEYRFETASVDGTRKWITKSGFPTRQDALNQGALDYTEYYKIGRVRRNKDMSYSDYLDYWIDTYCNFNLKYSTIVTYLTIIKLYLKPMLIEQGADIKAVSKRLGHSTIMTTYNIYVRVTNKMETETVNKFEDYANTLDIPPVQDIEYQD